MKKILCILITVLLTYNLIAMGESEQQIDAARLETIEIAVPVFANNGVYATFEPLKDTEKFTVEQDEQILTIFATSETDKRFLFELDFSNQIYVDKKIVFEYLRNEDSEKLVIGSPIFSIIDGKQGIAEKIGEGFTNVAIENTGYLAYQKSDDVYSYDVYSINEKKVIDTFTFKAEKEFENGYYTSVMTDSTNFRIEYRLHTGKLLATGRYNFTRKKLGGYDNSLYYTYPIDIELGNSYTDGEIYKSFEPLAEDEVLAWEYLLDDDVIEIYAQNTNSKEIRFLTNFSTATFSNDHSAPYANTALSLQMTEDRKTAILGLPIFGIIDGKTGTATKLGDSFYDFAISDDAKYIIYRLDDGDLETPYTYYVYNMTENKVIDEFRWRVEEGEEKFDWPSAYKTIFVDNSFYLILNPEYNDIYALAEYDLKTKELVYHFRYNDLYTDEYSYYGEGSGKDALLLWDESSNLTTLLESLIGD